MTPKPSRASRGDSDSAADLGRGKYVMHTSKDKKGALSPLQARKFSRSQNRSDANPLTAIDNFKGGVGRTKVGSALARTVTGQQALHVHLAEDDITAFELKSTSRRSQGAKPKSIKVKQGKAKSKKPLINLLKAPMTRAEAKALGEAVRAADGPRRKLPPRP
ncbi:hypothetical protein [Streptomyces californicus]|uniref:hypothetical protein n=1 Tax=Streptomyces californicus TaxID=67351 RepID=UPI001E60BE9C|nr:hypothetical protein [Streptomyces californicus]MCC0575264.1 hypothetical protein [Streptomyces californicus]